MRRHLLTIPVIMGLWSMSTGVMAQADRGTEFYLTAFPFGTGSIDDPVDLLVDGNGYVWLLDQHAVFCLFGNTPVQIRDLNTPAKVLGWQEVTSDEMIIRTDAKAVKLTFQEWAPWPQRAIRSDQDALRNLHLPDGREVQLTDSGSLVVRSGERITVQDLTIELHSNRFALIPGEHGRMVYDQRNGIWILGKNGLLLASDRSPPFQPFDTPVPFGKITQVVEEKSIDRRLILSQTRGVLIEKLSTGELIRHFVTDANGHRLGGTKWHVVNGRHFFQGAQRVYAYDPATDSIVVFMDFKEALKRSDDHARINDLAWNTKSKYLYAGSEDNLLLIVDPVSREMVVREVKPPGTFSGINLILETEPFAKDRALVIAEHGQFLIDGMHGPIRPAQEEWPSFQFGPNFRASGAKILGDSLVVISSFADGLFLYDIRRDSLYRPAGPDMDQLLISDIFSDGLHHVYGSTRDGLLIYDVQDNTARMLNGKQGLPLDNLFYRYMSNGAPGEMFMGLTDRYVRFTTADLIRTDPQDLFIERLEVNGQLITDPPYRAVGTTVDLNYLQNNLGIRLGSPLRSGTPFTSFFVRLDDQRDQVEFHEARDIIRLHALAPGEHHIQMALASNGPFTDLLTLHIAPPLWRSWWFITLLILATLTLILFLFRIRLQHVRHEATMKAEYDARIAQLELSSLRGQMHPHFIFNSLNSIKSFIAENEPRTATRYLNKFSQLVRSILNNSRHNRVDLRSEMKALQLYLELEQMRFENSFELSIIISPDIDQDSMTIPPLILQPYAENAIWHGLMHKDGDRKLEVEVSKKDNMLLATVRDNGIGRKAAQQMKSRSATKHKSLGMNITSEIIQRTHKDGTTGVEIKDLVDAHGDPCGTEVNISIPIEPGS